MKKQTAVDWLMKEFYGELQYVPITRLDRVKDIFQRAKQMEKEQIMKAVYDSMGTNFDPNMGRAELYYQTIYGDSNK